LPGWLKWTSTVGFCATTFSLLISAYPFVQVVDARAYAAKILGTLLLSNLVAVFFYKLRSRLRVLHDEPGPGAVDALAGEIAPEQ
jgi:glutamate:GABA antiporter